LAHCNKRCNMKRELPERNQRSKNNKKKKNKA
jgi:hypothetical protein